MPPPATRKTPASKSKTRTEFDDFIVTSRDDEAETFTANIFGGPSSITGGETFVFSTDINAYLQLAAFSGRSDSFIEFMDSLVAVPLDGDEDEREVERKTREEGDRFHGLLKAQKGLTVERLAQFVADITEAAGERPTNSSPA